MNKNNGIVLFFQQLTFCKYLLQLSLEKQYIVILLLLLYYRILGIF